MRPLKVKSKRLETESSTDEEWDQRTETTKIFLRLRRKMAIFSWVTCVNDILRATCRLTYGDVVHERRKLFILCGTEMNGEASRNNKYMYCQRVTKAGHAFLRLFNRRDGGINITNTIFVQVDNYIVLFQSEHLYLFSYV